MCSMANVGSGYCILDSTDVISINREYPTGQHCDTVEEEMFGDRTPGKEEMHKEERRKIRGVRSDERRNKKKKKSHHFDQEKRVQGNKTLKNKKS